MPADPDLYILERGGFDQQPGCIYVLNILGDKWSGTSVKTKWQNQKFTPVAWDGHDIPHPDERTTDGEGNAEFPAPPRGYAVYTPIWVPILTSSSAPHFRVLSLRYEVRRSGLSRI
jgi:alpha-amylase